MLREVVQVGVLDEDDMMRSSRKSRSIGDLRDMLMLMSWRTSMMTMMMSCLELRGRESLIGALIGDLREHLKEAVIEDLKGAVKEKDPE